MCEQPIFCLAPGWSVPNARLRAAGVGRHDQVDQLRLERFLRAPASGRKPIESLEGAGDCSGIIEPVVDGRPDRCELIWTARVVTKYPCGKGGQLHFVK